jgi:hypothetical protein
MIQLSEAAMAAYSHLKNPPTHAKIMHLRHTVMPEGINLADMMKNSITREDQVLVVYALGTVTDGKFTASPHLDVIQTLIDLKDYSDEPVPPSNNADALAHHHKKLHQSQAAVNLFAAGVVPKPGAPHQAKAVPGKPAGEYRYGDLDAVVAFFDDRLAGTVV